MNDSDDILKRQADLQSGPVPPVPPTPPGKKPSQNIDSPSAQDKSSRGTQAGPRLVDENSQFRKPEDIKTVERGQEGLAKIQRMKPGTTIRHGNILVKLGGVIGEVGEDGGGNDSAYLEQRIDQLEQIIRTLVSKPGFLLELKNNLPDELRNASWSWAGQNPPAVGSVLQVVANADGSAVGWGEGGGGINFVTDGEVKVAGLVISVSWTANDADPALVPDIWIEVLYDGSAVNIHRDWTGYPYTATADRASVRIRKDGQNIQNCDYSLERVST